MDRFRVRREREKKKQSVGKGTMRGIKFAASSRNTVLGQTIESKERAGEDKSVESHRKLGLGKRPWPHGQLTEGPKQSRRPDGKKRQNEA